MGVLHRNLNVTQLRKCKKNVFCKVGVSWGWWEDEWGKKRGLGF